MSEAFRYKTLADTLARVGYPQEPAGYHGALCGALCVQDGARVDVLQLADAARDGADDAVRDALARLRDETERALGGPDASFDLLLPSDDSSLEQRTRALVAWCDGFLYGLASQNRLDLQKASEEVREAVSDITQFTRATLESDDDSETEEAAFAELVEYLRVAVQLIHVELHGGAADDGNGAPAPSRMH